MCTSLDHQSPNATNISVHTPKPWDMEDPPEGIAETQIRELAEFIMNEVPGEPSQSEGAVECAIRIIKNYQNALKRMQQLLSGVATKDSVMESEKMCSNPEYEELKTDRTSFGDDEMRHRFGYHKPANPTIAQTHQTLRGVMTSTAMVLDRYLPEGRAKSTAITKLEEALMWSNKAVAEMSPVVDE